MFAAEKDFASLKVAPIEAKGDRISKDFGESFWQNWEFQRFARNSDSRQQNLHDEFDSLIDDIKQTTGTELSNPYKSGWGELVASNASFAKDMLIGFPDPADKDSPYRHDNKLKAEQQRISEFYKKADKLREKNPDMPYRSYENIQENIRNKAHTLKAQLEDGRITNRWGEFLGTAGGAMTDPVNATVTLLTGGAGAARASLLAALGRTALWEGGTNMLSEAIVQFSDGGVKDYNQELGLDYSNRDAWENVGMAGVGGAVLGAGMVAAGRTAKSLLKTIKTAKNKGFKLKPSEEVAEHILQEKANLDDYMAKTNPYGNGLRGNLEHLNDFLRERERIINEQEQLLDGINQVTINPRGPKNDPLINIKPSDMEGVIIERGEYRPVTGTGTKSGYGLVKFVWKHGELGTDAVPIMKKDILDFPRIIREYEPLSNDRYGTNRMWSVKRDDGVQVIYADKDFGTDGSRRLVSIHTLVKKDHDFYDVLSPKRKPGQALSEHASDTASGAYYRSPESAAKAATQKPRFQDVARGSSDIISNQPEKVNLDYMPGSPDFENTLKNYADGFSEKEIAEIEKLVDAHALEIPTGETDGKLNKVSAKEYLSQLKEEKTAVDEIAACITEFNR